MSSRALMYWVMDRACDRYIEYKQNVYGTHLNLLAGLLLMWYIVYEVTAKRKAAREKCKLEETSNSDGKDPLNKTQQVEAALEDE